jgi:hypothetical protein
MGRSSGREKPFARVSVRSRRRRTGTEGSACHSCHISLPTPTPREPDGVMRTLMPLYRVLLWICSRIRAFHISQIVGFVTVLKGTTSKASLGEFPNGINVSLRPPSTRRCPECPVVITGLRCSPSLAPSVAALRCEPKAPYLLHCSITTPLVVRLRAVALDDASASRCPWLSRIIRPASAKYASPNTFLTARGER